MFHIHEKQIVNPLNLAWSDVLDTPAQHLVFRDMSRVAYRRSPLAGSEQSSARTYHSKEPEVHNNRGVSSPEHIFPDCKTSGHEGLLDVRGGQGGAYPNI